MTRTKDHHLQLQPPPRHARLVLAALSIGLPLLTIFIILIAAPEEQQRLAEDSALRTMMIIIALTVPMYVLLDWALRRHHMRLDQDRLSITTTFFKRELPLSDIKSSQARIVNLEERIEFKPALKANGFSLPGMNSGWYRLRNGNRAFVAIAAGPRVLWLPTTRGYDLLLQPSDAGIFLERLRELAPTGGHD